jgi:hypothetical protein
MADTAAWLVDRVFPDVPVRQVVLSLPFELRFLLARDPELLLAVRRIFVRSYFALQRRQAREHGFVEPRPAAVVAVQFYDSALRLNPHFHALVVDGVFVVPSGCDRATFHPLPAPTDEQLARVTARIIRRVLALLQARGLLREDGRAACSWMTSEAHSTLARRPRSRVASRSANMLVERCLAGAIRTRFVTA